MGACLALMSLGVGAALPLRSLVPMAPPIDFSKMGGFLTPIREDPTDALRAFGFSDDEVQDLRTVAGFHPPQSGAARPS